MRRSMSLSSLQAPQRPSAKSKSYARSQSRVAAPPSRWSAPKLSEQLVRQHALKNTIIVAFSNKNHLDYTFNWINYVRVSNRRPPWCSKCVASPDLPCLIFTRIIGRVWLRRR